jgi:hypothetical protein
MVGHRFRVRELQEDHVPEEVAVVWIIVAILVVAVLAVLALIALRRRRSEQLQERFGPEYERVVQERGDQRTAESELQERFHRRESFELRALDPGARQRYAERWERVQREFVDRPAGAIADADDLVSEVMRDRGYPVEGDFEQRAADVSVDHPQVVEEYRAAHAISRQSADGHASTEDLREAMVHFRALFDELLADEERRTTQTTR